MNEPLRQKVNIRWENINVSLKPETNVFNFWKKPTNTEPIIKNVSGCVKAGTLLGIMGASGSGKTTLLNVLNGRNLNNLKVTGVVYLNENVSTVSKITNYCAYVQQTDLFYSNLTVEEHLLIQARLRMNKDCKSKEQHKRVKEVIAELGLLKCQNVRIRSSDESKKSLSGGEMRRLAFATELLTNPSILFCDEPISGLDSFMAYNIIALLKEMASANRTVICTVHQPSSQVYEMLNQILLLAEGRVAFMGNLDDAYNFFDSVGFKCPSKYNPADFYIDKLAIIPGKEAECKQVIRKLVTDFAGSHYAVASGTVLSNEMNLDISLSNQSSFDECKITFSYKLGYFSQFLVLLKRCFLSNTREKHLVSIRIFQTIFTACLIAVVYWNQKYDQTGIMNINGALFLLITSNSFASTLAIINTFTKEIPILIREYHSGLYRISVYFISKLIADYPIFVVFPIIFASITYWPLGLYNSWSSFGILCLTLIMVSIASAGFGYFVSCSTTSITTGLAIAPTIFVPLMLLGGFFLNNQSIPSYLVWMKWLSWFYYGNEILIVNQWRYVDNISCPLVKDLLTSKNFIESSTCIKHGKSIISLFGYNPNHVFLDLLALYILTVIFRMLAFIILIVRVNLMR